jgi:hypothetical protein
MKRLVIAFVISLSIIAVSEAQMDMGGQTDMRCGKMQEGMMSGQRGQMMRGMMGDGMMSMCRQMMMGHGMTMHDMMYMMMDMMKMQKKILRGVKPDEKKELIDEIDKMMEKMEKMMSESRAMMRGGMMHMMHSEPKNGEQKKETPLKEAPKSEPHKH